MKKKVNYKKVFDNMMGNPLKQLNKLRKQSKNIRREVRI